MIELLSEVLKGKSTIIKNKQYLSSESYIQPFIDRFKDFDVTITCNVKPANQLSVTDNITDIVYNRVHIQVVFNSPGTYENVIGMIYGLDTRMPVAKFYRGLLDSNGNFISFNSDDLQCQKIEEELTLDYSFVDESIDMFKNQDKWNKLALDEIDALSNCSVPYMELTQLLGEWVDKSLSLIDISDFGKVKLATSIPINGYKYLVKDVSSPYFTEVDTNKFNIYRALLQALSDEDDIINIIEKTYLINKLIGL